MPQEIQSDPLNNPHEHGSQATSNPVPSNRPLRDLLYARNREKYIDIGLPLYEASIRCDWKAAEAILDKNPDMNLLRQSITINGETALHIAASVKGSKKVDEFVRNLVGRMRAEDLELVNNDESTALYLAAAAGNIETVKIMMERNSTLDTIPGGGGDKMPLYAAVLFGNKDVARYLYEHSKGLGKVGLEDITVDWNVWNVRNCNKVVWNDTNRDQLLKKCVESDMFDIALKIMEPRWWHDSNLGTLLALLARKHEAFNKKQSSNTESNIIRRTIKCGFNLRHATGGFGRAWHGQRRL